MKFTKICERKTASYLSNMNLGTVYNLQIKQDFHQLRKKTSANTENRPVYIFEAKCSYFKL